MKKVSVIVMLMVCVSLTAQASFLNDAEARTYSEHGTAGKAGLITASVVTSALYIPFKAAYAILGGATSGLTYAVTMAKESEAAHRIATRSFTGDWYIHPDILTSHELLNFSGPDDTAKP